jgi:hypothetical protein
VTFDNFGCWPGYHADLQKQAVPAGGDAVLGAGVRIANLIRGGGGQVEGQLDGQRFWTLCRDLSERNSIRPAR